MMALELWKRMEKDGKVAWKSKSMYLQSKSCCPIYEEIEILDWVESIQQDTRLCEEVFNATDLSFKLDGFKWIGKKEIILVGFNGLHWILWVLLNQE